MDRHGQEEKFHPKWWIRGWRAGGLQ